MNENACPPIIRRAVEADLPEIVGLLADDMLGAKRESPDDLAPYKAAFALIDSDPHQFLAVMERSHIIVGTLQLSFITGLSRQGATRAQIEGVRISSVERGHGLGKVFMEWAIEEARRRDCAMVQLTSDVSRTDAHRFYLNLGFELTHSGFKYVIDRPSS
jgi:GNAT superfamily N-acetyltransferase